jgi:hypothetical protein
MDPMINCHVNVIMTGFKPHGEKPADVIATLELTSQTPNPGGKPYFVLNGSSLTVSIPTGTPGRVEYSLVDKTGGADTYYIFGMFFTKPSKHVQQDSGMFPLVVIAQGDPLQASMLGYDISPAPYTVSVIDRNDASGFWEYSIGIQDLNTGVIGILDPDIGNDPPI